MVSSNSMFPEDVQFQQAVLCSGTQCPVLQVPQGLPPCIASSSSTLSQEQRDLSTSLYSHTCIKWLAVMFRTFMTSSLSLGRKLSTI
jgi:hypothetical protein